MKLVIYIAIFFSSIVGVQIAGISVNKLALIPFEFYLFFKNYGKANTLKVSKRLLPILSWYGLVLLSSLSGLLFLTFYAEKYYNQAVQSDIINIIQSFFIYIPIVIFLSHYKGEKAHIFIDDVFDALIFTARIQCCWAILQVVLYYLANFDLNEFLFVQILKQSNNWTGYSNLAERGILLRPTGLNRDAAFLGMIMIFGIISDKKKFWRFLYFLTILLSFSRSALITVLIYVIYKLILQLFAYHPKIHFNLKKFIVSSLEIAALIILAIFVIRIPFINNQLVRMIERLRTVSTGADGTSRHMAYPLLALEIMLFNYPIVQKLFGIGIDISGTAINVYNSSLGNIQLTQGMINNVWGIECDYAGVLLGTGLVGTVLYYSMLIKAYKKSNNVIVKDFIFALLVFGLMYNYAWLTLFQLLLWVFIIDSTNLSN